MSPRVTKAMFVVAVLLLAPLVHGDAATGTESQREPSVRAMLTSFVEDYRSDPFASRVVTFGIRVKDAEPPDWQVTVAGRTDPKQPADVRLGEGMPEVPSAYFVTDTATLRAIHRGEMASLTALAKAFGSDFAPLDFAVMDGFVPGPDFRETILAVAFHFWTKGFPETIRFGDKSLTRPLHGGHAVLFYYQKGFRSAWFLLEHGDHVNEDPKMQSNEFPTMIIVTRGTMKARIGGEEIDLSEGQAIYIGAGVTHEFWNPNDASCEGVLLMFGEGA